MPTPSDRSIEAFGYSYNKDAQPFLPPISSVSMPIWGNLLPVNSIGFKPRFVDSPSPRLPGGRQQLLEEADCRFNFQSDLECTPDSPLNRFGCEWLYDTGDIDFGLDPNYPLVAECFYTPKNSDDPRDQYLFRRGCAFKLDTGYIFKIDDEYVMVNTEHELQEMFAPIENAAEALNYSQLITGLSAIYEFAYDHYLIYFQKTIEGTHVTEEDGSYLINLYHIDYCGCEPFITSEVPISVERDGQVTWNGATPVFMTTGFSCAD
jgi:hypothetical protein